MQFHRTSLVALATLVFVPPTLRAQTYERIDVDNLGQPPNAHCIHADISNDGRFVAFVSRATNLGGPDVVGTWDAFLRDRLLGTTTRVTNVLVEGPTVIQTVRMAGNGSMFAFMRGNGTGSLSWQSYLYVVSSGTITEILVPGLSDISVNALNVDGTYAVITADTTSTAPKVYRLHLATGAVVLCSRDMNGNPVAARFGGDIDDDGKNVTFWSNDPNIVPGDTNGVGDVFVYDIPGNIMLRASVALGGGSPSGESGFPSMSANGRYVAFESSATNLTVGDSNGNIDAFVRDLRLDVTTMVSLETSQSHFALGAAKPLISADASSVAFVSREEIQPGDSSFSYDTFLRDIEPGALLPVSPGSASFFEDLTARGITSDGREVLLVGQQGSLGGPGAGCFVAKFGPRCSSSGYCTSLPNSTGQSASIGAQGDASLQLNALVISAVGLPATANALVVSGSAAVDPGAPFGNGLLCIGGGMIRHGIHVASGGVILDAQDVHSAEYIGVNPGDTRYYQVVYRDPPAGGALFNTTDAVAVTFCW